ncbi:MAG: hypothetical protein ACK4VW_07945 [Anaerolineales bacterium]
MAKKLHFLLLAIGLITACTAEQTPSADLASVQATAIALAVTFSAQTLTAQPTATLPPTETPSPLPPSPLPTQTPLPTPTETAVASTCDKPLSPHPAGTIAAVILIRNESGGDALISLWLAPTPFGECGYRGFNISKGGTVSTSLPLGCYTATAYISTKDRKYSLSQGGLCFNNTDKWTFVIRPNRILLQPP